MESEHRGHFTNERKYAKIPVGIGQKYHDIIGGKVQVPSAFLGDDQE